MPIKAGTCPMTGQAVVDAYFIENRTRLLDVAAFLDRLDRATDGGGQDDYRMQAFRQALEVLVHAQHSRVEAIQLLLSDPRLTLLDQLDQKSANGAYAPAR